ncbi:hypothetical protein D9M68_967310 [compost metagenome]
MPTRAPSSVTGMWRMRRRVMRSMTSARSVVRPQVTTPRVMHSLMPMERAPDGFLPMRRTISRSERMPIMAPLTSVMTTAPILLALSTATASLRVPVSGKV